MSVRSTLRSRGALFLFACALTLGLSFCGYRSAGLEVLLSVVSPTSDTAAELDLARVELLACPDVPTRAVERAPLWSPSRAYAHDGSGPAMGPLVLRLPAGAEQAVLAVPPDSYCDVRVHAGSPEQPALVMASGAAAEREVVLRLVDAQGSPTRLTLARAPARAEVRIELGAFAAGDTPSHALSLVLGDAVARLVTP